MAKRIVIAVEPSTVPFALLDLVGDAARGGGATIRLVHVAPSPESVVDDAGRVLAYADQEMARLEAEALDALRAFELHLPDAQVDSAVRFGDPATEIVREAEEFGADLVAMAASTHGRVHRLVCGSVAEQVMRRAPMPVLVLREAL